MKKILSIFVLVLTLSFSTQAFASLTFTNDAITGTTASTIDLGAGNTLSLQTMSNGAINLGSGLLTSTGSATFGGNVGIGTINPQTALDINGNLNFKTTATISIGLGGIQPSSGQSLSILAGSGSTSGGSIYITGGTGMASFLAGNIILAHNGTSVIGKVGIGTSTPGYQLHVLAPSQESTNVPVDVMAVEIGAPAIGTKLGYGPSILFKDAGGSDVNNLARIAAVYEEPDFFAGALSFYTNSDTSSASTNPTEKMRITNTGNVGIGTTTPGSKLSIVGLPAYANNAAALTGGLVAGDLYYTDTAGEYIVKITH